MILPLAISLVLATTSLPAVDQATVASPLAASTLDASSTAARLTYVITQLALKGFDETTILRTLGDPRVKLYPPGKVTGQPIDWDAFEKGLLSKKSVLDGKTFSKKYATALANAQKKYGVDKNAVVAILRMESAFGKWMGSHNAFSVFYTNLLRPDLTDSKWKWAADNLVALMVHARNTKTDPLMIKSSWAGAVGMAQFLPVSIISYGKDGNKDGRVMMTGAPDAIASAANFLYAHGWKTDKAKALAGYYGSATGYPQAALKYAKALNPPVKTPAKKTNAAR